MRLCAELGFVPKAAPIKAVLDEALHTLGLGAPAAAGDRLFAPILLGVLTADVALRVIQGLTAFASNVIDSDAPTRLITAEVGMDTAIRSYVFSPRALESTPLAKGQDALAVPLVLDPASGVIGAVGIIHPPSPVPHVGLASGDRVKGLLLGCLLVRIGLGLES